jgi:hypothetical protein
MVLPLGYARQTDLPGKPFDSRRYLVGFLGSIENRAYPKFSPKLGFIKRKRFDHGGVFLEDRLNLVGHRAVNVESWGDKHEFGALPSGDY